MESWVHCPTWTNRTQAFYTSPEFLAVQEEEAPFLESLKPLVGGNRSVALADMWNLFDFVSKAWLLDQLVPTISHLPRLSLQMNVQSIHNAEFLAQLEAKGPDTLARVRDLAK